MNTTPALQPAYNLMLAQEDAFKARVSDDSINFQKEIGFALQILGGNSYTARVAMQDQESFKNAIINVAAIGISLNPAKKDAYLVPRGGKVCLDISYQGLKTIAEESGAVQWSQAKIVHAKDTYQNNGVGEAPTHSYNAFGDRGEIVGAYCVARLHDGSFMTEEMPIAEIHRIRARSESFKKGGSSPWKTDEGEMIKKTIVKRAAKQWPKTGRLGTAIDYLNNNGEGIDFKSEQREQGINATAQQKKEIHALLEKTGSNWESVKDYACRTLFGGEQVETVDELTEKQADQITGILKMKAARSTQ